MPNALILGASRGLGLGLAREFAARGWAVTGTVRKVADRAALEGTGAAAAVADITDANGLRALHGTVPGPLDLLFVNAGISEPADVSAIDEAGLGHLFMTNAVAPIRAAELFVDRMAPDGTVAFMSSRLGSVGLRRNDAKNVYGASKAALNALIQGFVSRLPRPRPVLTLHPGWVRTDMGGSAATLDVPTSVRGLAEVVLARRGPGLAFLDHTGAELPW